jgi:starch-binding outer membrane protein SusE/F
MKKIFWLGHLCLFAILTLSSCKKEERSLDLNLTAVGNLSAPADAADIALAPATPATVDFKWDAAQAADGGLVLYEIAFDKEGGDFSQPIYKTVSNGSGLETMLTLTHKELNKIANAGGIAASSSGKLKWTVFASKGTNDKASAVSRTLQLNRPAGFADIPAALYLTGTATEGGSEIAQAIPLKKKEEGVFEIYTSLKPGDYIITDGTTANAKKYYLDNGGMIKEGETPVTVTGDPKTYRLTLDFNVATSQVVEIQSVGLFMPAYNTEIGTLSYAGNGTWRGDDIPVEFFPFDWGRDERYKFVLHTPAGPEYVGSMNANNVPPAGQPDAYFYVVPVTSSPWDNTYKFDPSADRQRVKVDLIMKSDGAYTHTVTVK